MMKKIFYTLLVAAIVGMVSCKESAPAYDPAPKVDGAEVFFDSKAPSKVEINDSGIIEVNVLRGKTTDAVVVGVTSVANAIFNVPSSVSFAAGSDKAVLSISYDIADVVMDQTYPFELALSNDVTPYGVQSINFDAILPNPIVWNDITTVSWYSENFMSTFWSLESPLLRKVKMQKQEGKEIYRMVAPFGEKYPYNDPGDWFTDKDYNLVIDCETDGWKDEAAGIRYATVAAQQMGLDRGYGSISIAGFYPNFNGSTLESAGEFNVNTKTFVFPERTLLINMPNYQSGGWYYCKENMIYLDERYMTTDYNTLKYSLLYGGEAKSMIFSNDGVTPVSFTQKLGYNAKDQVYYLADYFTDGFGLAFISDAVADLTNDSEISKLDSPQETGLQIFGSPVYYEIRKGSVSIGDDKLPTFTVTVRIYTKDAAGNIEFLFGDFNEVYTATSFPEEYSVDDLKGVTKASYVGTFIMTAKNYFNDGIEYEMPVTITDAGIMTDASGNGFEAFIVKGLSGMDPSRYSDEVIAEWYNGYMYFFSQNAQAFGSYSISFLTGFADASTKTVYSGDGYVVGGIVKTNNKLALVDYPSNPNPLNGFIYSAGSAGSLAINYNYYGPKSPASGAPVAYAPAYLANSAIAASITTRSEVSVPFINASQVSTVVKAKAATPAKTVNTSNVSKFETSRGNILEGIGQSIEM